MAPQPKQNSKRGKKMRKYEHHTLYIVIIVMLFGLITINNSDDASALSYQSNIDIGFTFLPTLNVSLSSDSLTINNLIPGGNAADSNTITINVSTNIAEGYNLYTTVGSSTNNTTNLINTSDNNYTFTPLSSNIPNLNSFTNNNWGYSYSNDSGTTWISGDYNNTSNGYNGLPLYTNTGIKLVEEADNTSSTVDFKIAAKAGSTQPSGEYTNTINFTAVSNTIPTTMLDAFIASDAQMYKGYFKMQDMTPTICSSIDTDGEKGMQLIDVRDDKVYWVAKLKDNNCWMTQNLDLDLSSSVALTSETSDIDPESYGKAIYTAETGYSKDSETNVVSWLPERSTYTSTSAPGANNWAGNTGNSSTSGYYHPYSWNRIKNNNGDPVYPDSTVTEATAGNHAQSGNYYNWSAAVASNNTVSTSGTQTNSICPKGWELPINSEYETLFNAYKTPNHNYNAFGLMASPLWFVRSGFVNDNGSLQESGTYGAFWLDNPGRGLAFYNSQVYSNDTQNRFRGISIRCLAK